MLLVHTHCGNVFCFRQPSKNRTELVSLDDWEGKLVVSHSSSEKPLVLKWLHPLAAWHWPGSRGASALENGMQGLFHLPRDQKAEAKGGDTALHWVRPGLLSLAAVMSSGHVRIWSCFVSKQDFFWSERKTSITGVSESSLLLADIVTAQQQTLRVGIVKQAEPSSVVLMEMRGDPTAESNRKACGKLTMARIATVSIAALGSDLEIANLHFDPATAGRNVTCILREKGGEGVVLVSLRQKGKANYETCGTMRLPVGPPAAPSQMGTAVAPEPLCAAVSREGCMLALANARGARKLHLVRLAAMHGACEDVQIDGGEADGGLLGAAFSPNGTCLAVVSAPGSRPRLEVHCLTDYSMVAMPGQAGHQPEHGETWGEVLAGQRQISAQADLAADRAMWCIINSHHHWDVVERLKAFSGVEIDNQSAEEPQSSPGLALPVIFGRLDEAFHAQPFYWRGGVCRALDRLKVAVLSYENDLDALVVAMDAQARIFLGELEMKLRLFFDQAEFVSIKSERTAGLKQHDMEALIPWMMWLMDFCHYFIRNCSCWVDVHRKIESGEATPDMRARVNWLTGVRLLGDMYFHKCVAAVAVFLNFSLEPHSSAALIRQRLQHMIGFVRLFCTKTGGMSPQQPEPEPALDEGVGVQRELAAAAASSFSGRYCIHFARPTGQISWQTIADICQSERSTLQMLPSTVEQLKSFGLKMGLLPPKLSSTARGSVLIPTGSLPPCPPRTELPRFFLTEPRLSLAPNLDAARRKRRRAERDTALGICQALRPRCGDDAFLRDANTGNPIGKGPPPTHMCLESHYVTTALAADSLQLLDRPSILYGACSSVCSLSGGRWRRIAREL